MEETDEDSPTYLTTLLLTAAFGLTASCALAGSLKDPGKSASHPFKKGAHNAGKTVREGAGHASKTTHKVAKP